MRTLMTGATGFIGGHLAARLVEDGELHVVARPASDTSRLPAGAVVHRHDGTAGQLGSILAAAVPDVVYHLASRFQDRHTSDDIIGLVDDNVAFTAMLADAMVRADCRNLVNTGTAWQHFEDADYAPVCLYAATKQAGEAVLRYFTDANDLRVITLKLHDTYGPGDRRRKLLPQLMRAIAAGTRIDMSPGEQLIDLVHVGDVVAAYVAAAQRLQGGEVVGMESYAVSSGAPLELRRLVGALGQAAGVVPDIGWGCRPYRPREVMVPWSGGPRLPGWMPRMPLDAGLRQLVSGVT